MAFMTPEVQYDTWAIIDGCDGIRVLPYDCFHYPEHMQDDGIEVRIVRGYSARLQASGYTDCTEWMLPVPTAEAALFDLCGLYDIDSDGEPIY